MTATFAERIDELRKQVGTGLIEGDITVDQVYAHYQDSGEGPRGKPAAAFDHPEGGTHGYLSDTLTTYGPVWAQHVADSISEEEPMVHVFIGAVQDLRLSVDTLAPIEFGNLKDSAEITVIDNGDVAFDSPPIVPRLSAEELRQLGKFSKWKYGGRFHHEWANMEAEA